MDPVMFIPMVVLVALQEAAVMVLMDVGLGDMDGAVYVTDVGRVLKAKD